MMNTKASAAQSPDSVPRSSGSVDPATPADPVVAGSPRELSGMTPVAPVRAPAITSSCSVSLRSGLRLATDSGCGCAPAPCGADATAVAADHDSPSSATSFIPVLAIPTRVLRTRLSRYHRRTSRGGEACRGSVAASMSDIGVLQQLAVRSIYQGGEPNRNTRPSRA